MSNKRNLARDGKDMTGYTRGHRHDVPLSAFDPRVNKEEYEADLLLHNQLQAQVDDLILQDHTPAGWLPKNQRPGYVSDWRAERRGA